MATCARCGSEMHEGDAFCRTCGASAGASAAAGGSGPWPMARGAEPLLQEAVWPDGSPAMDEFQPLEGKARWAKLLLVLAAVLAAITVPLNLHRATAIETFISTGDPSDLERSDDYLAALLAPSSIIGIATIVLFLVWFSRAYKNLPPLGIRNLRFTSGWAVGAWFVPFLNFVRPKAIANDIWKGSDPELPPGPTADWRNRPVDGFVHWWWGIYLASLLTVTLTIGDPQTFDEQDAAYARIDAFRNVLSIVAALLAIRYVARVTERQGERAERAGAA